MVPCSSTPLRAMGVGLALIASIGVIACNDEGVSESAAARTAEVVTVQAVPVRMVEIQRGIDVTGTLFPDDEVEVAAKSPGRIATVLKDVGDAAAPGELLAHVDQTDYELMVVQREAALTEALSRLGIDFVPSADFDLAGLPAVLRAKAQERNALARFERGKQLFDSDPPLISQQEMADLETSLEVARHNVRAEQLAGQTLISQSKVREAELAEARQQLADTKIQAPNRAESGGGYLVAERLVAMGEFVERGQVVFDLVDSDPIKFRAEVPERYAGRIAKAQRVHITVESFAEPFIGEVTRIGPRVDPESRTFLVQAELKNPQSRLKPGAFAMGHIETHREQGVAFVPVDAVVNFAGVKRIFSVQDGKAIEHRIETGVRIGPDVEVIGGGLLPDAMIVVQGAHRLVNGSPVQVGLAGAEGAVTEAKNAEATAWSSTTPAE